jgi:hypothetical protein
MLCEFIIVLHEVELAKRQLDMRAEKSVRGFDPRQILPLCELRLMAILPAWRDAGFGRIVMPRKALLRRRLRAKSLRRRSAPRYRERFER